MLRVSTRVAALDAEAARARLLDLAPRGFEEVEHGGGTLELAVYVSEEEARAIAIAFPEATATRVGPGWEDRWREFHRGVIAGGLWLGPPWEAPPADLPTVVIEPGRAFGTGAHPTTRACIELLAHERRGSVLDVGCGSGVISIAAVRLGFARVLALDVDPVAVEVTRENAARNGAQLDVRERDARDSLPAADLLVANIELETIEALLATAGSARAITSGYLSRDVPRGAGWRHVDRLELDGWAADVFEALY